jgi:hypothetical protein
MGRASRATGVGEVRWVACCGTCGDALALVPGRGWAFRYVTGSDHGSDAVVTDKARKAGACVVCGAPTRARAPLTRTG